MTTIVCANCGARFKLPEGFRGQRARCSKCGASIDVQAQAAEPVEPAPAPRAPARARAGAAGARGGYGARGGRMADDGDEEPKKSKTPLVIGVSLVSLALLVTVGIFLMKGDDQKGKDAAKGKNAPTKVDTGGKATSPKTDAVAKNEPVKPDPAKNDAAAKDATADKTPEAQKPVDATKPGALAQDKPVAQSDPKKADETKPAAKKPDDQPKMRFTSGLRVITSPDQIFDPKKELKEMPLAADVTDAERQAINDNIQVMMTDSSIKGRRASTAVSKMGHKAIAPLINKLRECDYKTIDGNRAAEDLNKALQDLLKRVNAGFKYEYANDDKLNLPIADWNARIVAVWQEAVEKWGTKETFEELMKQHQQNLDEQEKKLEAQGK